MHCSANLPPCLGIVVVVFMQGAYRVWRSVVRSWILDRDWMRGGSDAVRKGGCFGLITRLSRPVEWLWRVSWAEEGLPCVQPVLERIYEQV